MFSTTIPAAPPITTIEGGSLLLFVYYVAVTYIVDWIEGRGAFNGRTFHFSWFNHRTHSHSLRTENCSTKQQVKKGAICTSE